MRFDFQTKRDRTGRSERGADGTEQNKTKY